MWNTESLWFEVSIVSIIYALGNILMGHFQEHTPKIRSVGKYHLTIIMIYGISVFCSCIIFNEKKRYKWLDRRTQKQVL